MAAEIATVIAAANPKGVGVRRPVRDPKGEHPAVIPVRPVVPVRSVAQGLTVVPARSAAPDPKVDAPTTAAPVLREARAMSAAPGATVAAVAVAAAPSQEVMPPPVPRLREPLVRTTDRSCPAGGL